jgi:hypothetical protein
MGRSKNISCFRVIQLVIFHDLPPICNHVFFTVFAGTFL